ncbi:MAG TPA: phosphoserine phosphatase SerB [Thermoanaerobaculia bacterium]
MPSSSSSRDPEAVLTMVTPADGHAAACAERAAAALRRLGAAVDAPCWLADGEACDLVFAGLEPAAAEAAARRALAGEAVDLAAQPAAGRRKRLLVADMESTVIANEMLDELAELAGCGAAVAAVTARAMNGELDFRAALEERVARLAGLPVAAVGQALARLEVTAGAAVLVATMRAHGAFTALVSGGFGVFAEPVRRRLGFDLRESNELEIAAGRLSGRVVEPVRDRAAKLRTLERLCRERSLEPGDAAAVGDGANDLAMLAAAGLGVAFRARPSVARAARFRVDHADLTALLYFQGYRRAEFSAPC